jgi:hypothetical protein
MMDGLIGFAYRYFARSNGLPVGRKFHENAISVRLPTAIAFWTSFICSIVSFPWWMTLIVVLSAFILVVPVVAVLRQWSQLLVMLAYPLAPLCVLLSALYVKK